MKKITFISALLILFLVVTSAVFAQGGMHRGAGSGGWGMNSAYTRMYNPKTVETIHGTVDRIDEVSPQKGMSQGVHLTVKTEKGPVSVHLGPAWYLRNQDVIIKTGDQVEITGSQIEFNGKPAIIAKQVVKGDDVLTLRDDTGTPAWSGWRRRSG